jgi:L-amino acid N-acyltransferase YncA
VVGSPISFETQPPDAEEMQCRIESGGALYPWLVCEDESDMLGYAYASPFRPRPAYRWTVETSVYVTEAAHGQGVGARLYEPLLAMLEEQGFTQAIAAIALPNPVSTRFHAHFGFRRIGAYEQVGYKEGWRDVELWQRCLAAPDDPPLEPRPFGLSLRS